MKIEIIPCLSDNYSYIICDEQTNTISIVDPATFSDCEKVVSKYRKLDYILNTHHHVDHVGGNVELKRKYNSKIMAYEGDKDRIPEVDILLRDNEIKKIGNLEFKIILIPGHTSGHIAFYFYNEDIIFTGDTLFSLGCGRVFEGTHKQMLKSLNKIKKLPLNTKAYFGHEYTKNNLNFCLKYDHDNTALKNKSFDINSKLERRLPTTPTSIGDELKTNIFLRCNDKVLKKTLNLEDSQDHEVFTKLRDLKDAF